MPVVARIEVPPPAPFVEGEDGAEARGEGYRFIAPHTATEPLVMEAGDGSVLLWTPTELCYKDEHGNIDFIAGSAPVQLEVRGREARYRRTFPASDEVHIAQPEGRKYWLILHERPRDPASYLQGEIWFGVSGIVGGVRLPTGVHKAFHVLAFEFKHPFAADLMDAQTGCWYEVIDTEDGGQQLFIWCRADWLLSADRVYPVKIDPTIGVISSQGDFLVQFSNGELMYFNSPTRRRWHSNDGGQTWVERSQLPELSGLAYLDVDPNGQLWSLTLSFSDQKTRVYVHQRGANGALNQVAYGERTWYSKDIIYARGFTAKSSTLARIALIGDRDDTYRYIWAATATRDGSTITITQTELDYSSAPLSQTQITLSDSNRGTYVWYRREVGISEVSKYGKIDDTSLADWDYIDAAQPIIGLHGAAQDWFFHPAGKQLIRGSWASASQRYVPIPDVPNPVAAVYVPAENMIAVVGYTNDNRLCMQAYYISTGTWSGLAVYNWTVAPGQIVVPQRVLTGSKVPVVFRSGSDASVVMFEYLGFNTPPQAPTNLNRPAFDATEPAVFTWQFYDSDPGDGQARYQLQIVLDGATVYDSGTVQSPYSQHTLPAGTLQNGKTYQWRVRVADQAGEWSPWSNYATFQTGAAPVVTILYPTAGTVINTGEITVQWSVVDQGSARVRLYDAAGQNVLQEHVIDTPIARAKTLTGLANNTAYQVGVQVTSAAGITGAEVLSGVFSVQFTPPSKPSATATSHDGFVRISVVNPPPTGDQPDVASNEVLRREAGKDWVRTATGIAPNGTYDDYAVASGAVYEYRVRAVGANGTHTDSDVVEASITISGGIWLHDPRDPAGTVHWFQYHELPSSDRSVVPSGTFQFAGRRYPVVQMDAAQMERTVRYRLYLSDETDDRAALEALYARRTTLCLRNHRGRKYYVVFTEMPLEFERRGAWADVEFQVVDFDEEV